MKVTKEEAATELKRLEVFYGIFMRGITGEGFTLQPGKKYLLVFTRRLDPSWVADLQEYLTNLETLYECKFMVLHGYDNTPTIYEIASDINENSLVVDGGVQVITVARKFRPTGNQT